MPSKLNLTHALNHYAKLQPNKTATIDGDRTQTWLQLRDKIASLAAGLQKLGVKAGDKVSVISLNSDRYLEVYNAPWWMGAIIVPLNNRWSAKENLYALTDSESSVLFFDTTYIPVLEGFRAEVDCKIKHFIFMDDDGCPDWASPYNDVVTSNGQIEPSNCGDGDVAAIMYTGGTTGHPKGVILSHSGIQTSSITIVKMMDFCETDNYLHAAPMFHGADMALSVATTLGGSCHVFIPQFISDVVLETIKSHKISQALLVPTMIKMIVNSENFDKTGFSSLRNILYGASPMPEGLLITLLKELPDVGLVQAYGQTEMSPIVTLLPQADHTVGNPRLRSAGKPTIYCDIRIVDEDGNVLPTGEVGEIEASGPNNMLGYLNMPEQTAKTLKNGWVASGDAGYLAEDGYLYLVDRVKDMVVSGGENVFSAETESAVSTHPAILDVAVIGIPHDEWGEAVHAIVMLKPDHTATEQEIIDHTKSEIAGYKCPKTVEFRTEPFPVSAAGKTLKVEMRKSYWAGKDRSIN